MSKALSRSAGPVHSLHLQVARSRFPHLLGEGGCRLAPPGRCGSVVPSGVVQAGFEIGRSGAAVVVLEPAPPHRPRPWGPGAGRFGRGVRPAFRPPRTRDGRPAEQNAKLQDTSQVKPGSTSLRPVASAAFWRPNPPWRPTTGPTALSTPVRGEDPIGGARPAEHQVPPRRSCKESRAEEPT